MTNQLNREHVLTMIRHRQAKYAAIFNGSDWSPDELSDIGWLGLVGVPWLLDEVEHNDIMMTGDELRKCNAAIAKATGATSAPDNAEVKGDHT